MLHLHGFHHRQRLALAHLVASLDSEGHDLAGHGRAQAPGLGLALAGVGQQINRRDLRGAARGKDMVDLTARINRCGDALASKLDVYAAGDFQENQRPCDLADHQAQRAIVQIAQLGLRRFALELELETPLRHAMRLPAIAPAERVVAFCGPLVEQRLGNRGGACHGQPDRLLLEQQRLFALYQCGVQIGLGKRRRAQHVAQKLHIGAETDDVRLRQRLVEPGQRFFTRLAVHDQFGDHGVVVRRNGVALPHAVVDAHHTPFKAGADWLAVNMQRACGRQKIVVRAFGADARFDGVAVNAQLLLRQRQLLARRHAQLPLHQVQPGDRFGHRMLNLQPRIHLHEEEVHSTIRPLLDDELDRAGTDVIDGPRRRHRRFPHLFAHGLRHAGRRCFFQHLLVPPLHRAVTFKQIDVVAVAVAKHLDFNVARTQRIFFDQHRVVAKAVDGFALARGQRRGKVFGLVDGAHALAATARTGLDQHRVTDAVGFALQQDRVLVAAVVAGHQRHAGRFHQPLGLGLQAHGLDGGRRRADEDETRAGTGLGKFLVLAQKAVARMYRLRAGGLGRLDDALPAQVAVFGRAAANVHRLVAIAHMFGIGVGVRVNGHGLDGHAACRSRYTAGNFTAIGYEYFFKHGELSR